MSFLAVFLFLVFVVFGVLGIASVIRKKPSIKRNFLISLVSFIFMIVVVVIAGSQNTDEPKDITSAPVNNPSNNEVNTVSAKEDQNNSAQAQSEDDAKAAADLEAKQKADATAKAQAEAAKTKAANEAKQKAALAQMVAQVDEVEGITWYQDKTAPKYINENGIYAYFGTQDGKANTGLHLKIQYAAKTWLFIKNYVFNIDGEKYEIDPGLLGAKRDMSTDLNAPGIWEYYDHVLDESQIEMLQKMINSEKTIMRLEGDQKVVDTTLSATQKGALKRVLDAYIAAGGEI